MEKDLALFLELFNPEITAGVADMIVDEEILSIKEDISKFLYKYSDEDGDVTKERVRTSLVRNIDSSGTQEARRTVCIPHVIEVDNRTDESRNRLKEIIKQNCNVENTSFIYIVSAVNYVGEEHQGHWFTVVQDGSVIVIDSEAGESFADELCNQYVINRQDKLGVFKTIQKTQYGTNDCEFHAIFMAISIIRAYLFNPLRYRNNIIDVFLSNEDNKVLLNHEFYSCFCGLPFSKCSNFVGTNSDNLQTNLLKKRLDIIFGIIKDVSERDKLLYSPYLSFNDIVYKTLEFGRNIIVDSNIKEEHLKKILCEQLEFIVNTVKSEYNNVKGKSGKGNVLQKYKNKYFKGLSNDLVVKKLFVFTNYNYKDFVDSIMKVLYNFHEEISVDENDGKIISSLISSNYFREKLPKVVDGKIVKNFFSRDTSLQYSYAIIRALNFKLKQFANKKINFENLFYSINDETKAELTKNFGFDVFEYLKLFLKNNLSELINITDNICYYRINKELVEQPNLFIEPFKSLKNTPDTVDTLKKLYSKSYALVKNQLPDAAPNVVNGIILTLNSHDIPPLYRNHILLGGLKGLQQNPELLKNIVQYLQNNDNLKQDIVNRINELKKDSNFAVSELGKKIIEILPKGKQRAIE